jgi:radical SAM superfamily enzyme YgiQ (UPF0313 family)
MHTLLVRPFVDSTVGVSPPFSLMYLSAALKSRGFDARILDHCFERASMRSGSSSNPLLDALVARVRDHRPDVIGMTLFSRELGDMASLCTLLKREFPETTIVLGGPHPTARPLETLEQIPGCDVVVRGEAELILLDLVTALQSSRSLETVRGIAYRDPGGQPVETPDGDVPQDLDALPLPDRQGVIEHYRSKTYSSFVYGSPSDLLMTSRGCPFQCRFCFKVCVQYRSRSPENVLAEIDWVMDHVRPVSIQFMDDSFTIQRPRAHAILDGLIERRYPLRLKVRSRVNAVDEPLLRKMKQAGVDTIVFGLESGSQTMLDAFDKRTKVRQNIEACRMARRAGLHCLGDMILFYPGETRETLEETRQFIGTANPTAVKFYVLSPLPQTRVYEEAKANGTLVGDWTTADETPWVRLSEFGGIEEMQAIAKRMYLGSLMKPARALGILRAYGVSMLRNPRLATTLVLSNLRKKMKY